MSYPMPPGVYGTNLGFFQEAAPASAETIATIIGVSIPAGSLGCLIQAIGADVSYRFDGTAPTASVGFTLFAGQPPLWINGAQMRAMQIIQGAGGSSTLNIEFFGA